ncbi:MAG: Nif3-like dinuclear metal center hexameric protein [Candidatus Hodarchaeales archaeon]|jgi:putative NIF3 family GTP cyclohydrolase 1 type 2
MTDGSKRFTGVTKNVLDFLESLDMPKVHDFSLPFQFKERMFHLISQMKGIDFQEVVTFLEKRSPPLLFEYVGYDNPGVEAKAVDKIKGIFLMINPDPRVFDVIPPKSMVLCHHKISIYKNKTFQDILSFCLENKINVYNFHLAWDIMEDGIGDSFLYFLGYDKDKVEKKTLVYKGIEIPRLGSIIKEKVSLTNIITKLLQLNVRPSVVISPESENTTVGYIPGGGFVDQMMIDMASAGVDVLISSDPLWVHEILARELGITIVSINHYDSERYGLDNMQSVLSKQFPETPAIVLEETNNIRAKTELIIQDLIDIASQDGDITESEGTIITTTNKMINNFINEYNEAWKDKFISKEERSNLSRLWNMIYTETAKTIGGNSQLSFEERNLLGHLSRKIKDLD